MGEQTIGKKAVTATKWSLLTQIASKIIQPITTLVLAHILTPDLFGVIALVTMVTSFANMFSDAGFQKYLVQHEFKTDADLHDYANVAFGLTSPYRFSSGFSSVYSVMALLRCWGYHNWLGDNRCEFSSSTYSGNQCSDGALSKGAFV